MGVCSLSWLDQKAVADAYWARVLPLAFLGCTWWKAVNCGSSYLGPSETVVYVISLGVTQICLDIIFNILRKVNSYLPRDILHVDNTDLIRCKIPLFLLYLSFMSLLHPVCYISIVILQLRISIYLSIYVYYLG